MRMFVQRHKASSVEVGKGSAVSGEMHLGPYASCLAEWEA